MRTRSAALAISALALLAGGLLAAAPAVRGEARPARGPGSVTFRKKDPSPGDRRKEVRTHALTLRLAVKMDGADAGTLDFSKRSEAERLTTVLGPRKREVAYGRVVETEVSTGEAEKLQTKPVSGSTYLVERTDEGIRVARADGREIGLEEEVFVQGEFEDLGDVDELAAFLDGRTVRAGEALEVPKETFEGMFASSRAEELVVESFGLTLREVRPLGGSDCAVFAAAIRLAIRREGGPDSKVDLDGPILLRVDSCWPVAGDLRGPVKTEFVREAGGRRIEMKGDGEASFSLRADYSAE